MQRMKKKRISMTIMYTNNKHMYHGKEKAGNNGNKDSP